ncbi:MAG TPA: ATP-binding cassette domain-containing protein [Candidatus Limnocylindria bacterium]|jgi:ABC-type oligopeptide transport system ATPase subunit|nr:ATP-binding cassette domain-containing protein [Candidatus Limnocylindria bacterium]
MTATLEVADLVVEYAARSGFLARGGKVVRAVDGVSFAIEPGRTLGLVGESGSGKTSVARAILGFAPISAGRVLIQGRDVTRATGRLLREKRRAAQMVFQQPTTSLDPRRSVATSVAEPLVHLLRMRGKQLETRVIELLELVGLEAEHARRLPRQLSGGQRQRVAIARAIATAPSLVVCDEPTSSLDVSVQAQIINLLVRLQSELGMSYLFISHDLGTVRQIADTIAVMHVGRIVELGPVDEVLDAPRDDYTRSLIKAVPSVDRIVTRAKRVAAATTS